MLEGLRLVTVETYQTQGLKYLVVSGVFDWNHLMGFW